MTIIFCWQAEELAKSKLEKPKRLQQQAHREWQEIKHGSLKFQRRQQEAATLRQLTKPELVSFFKVQSEMTQEGEGGERKGGVGCWVSWVLGLQRGITYLGWAGREGQLGVEGGGKGCVWGVGV